MERSRVWFFLFPVVYLLHELEELVSFNQRKNQGINQFPKKLQTLLKTLSFSKFLQAILIETFLILLIWLGSQYAQSSFWFAISIVFNFHFFLHLLQSLFFRSWSLWAKSSLFLFPIASFFIIKTFPELYSEIFLEEFLIAIVLMLLFFCCLIFFFYAKKDCFFCKKS